MAHFGLGKQTLLMTQTPAKTWLTMIPMEFRDIPEFWQRDAGLVCLGFRAIGVESRFIALGATPSRDNLPLILASREQVEDAVWWRQRQPEGVVLWGAHRVDAIARAIKSAGARLVVHLDTDGYCSPHAGFWPYLRETADVFRDDGRRPAWLLAALKACLHRWIPRLHDHGFRAMAATADLLTINSPLAEQRVRRLLAQRGELNLAEKVNLIPSPLALDADFDPSVAKLPQIVAAGRWQSYQKDAPTALRVLGRVLEAHPDYSALMIGSGGERLERLRARLPAGTQTRIKLAGYVSRAELLQAYRQSQIMLVSSRFESLNLAAVEALACGCSVVGWGQIASLAYLASAGSGTTAPSRAVVDYADALSAEIAAWRRGERRPEEFGRHWRERFAAPGYAASVLAHFDRSFSQSKNTEHA